MKKQAVLVAILLAAVCLPDIAGARPGFTDRPFQLRDRGTGGGPGMSDAYRQAILNAELRNSRPDNLFRGSNGELLTVERRDGQAFISRPVSPFVVRNGFRSNGAFLSIGGVSIGVSRSSGFGPTGSSLWPFLLTVSARDAVNVAMAPQTTGAPTIDAWIRQLDSFNGY